jgi:ribosome maturation factor RimP
MPESKEELRSLVLPLLETAGVVLIDMHFSRGRHKSFLRLLVDKQEGGIRVEELAFLNDKIGKALDGQNLVSNSYVLEVSSPGLDRPLVNKEDFLRCRNRRVRIILKEAMQGRFELLGVVVEVKEGSLIVQKDDTLLEIPWEAIVKSYQVIGTN